MFQKNITEDTSDNFDSDINEKNMERKRSKKELIL